MATKKPDLLARVRRICSALPDTEESSRLGGEPHFYVRGKIFAGCGAELGVASVGMKVGLDLQAILIQRPGIHVAKYVGKHGWITVEERALADDAELERLLHRSYELIAARPPGRAKAAPSAGKRGTTGAGARSAAKTGRARADQATKRKAKGAAGKPAAARPRSR